MRIEGRGHHIANHVEDPAPSPKMLPKSLYDLRFAPQTKFSLTNEKRGAGPNLIIARSYWPLKSRFQGSFYSWNHVARQKYARAMWRQSFFFFLFLPEVIFMWRECCQMAWFYTWSRNDSLDCLQSKTILICYVFNSFYFILVQFNTTVLFVFLLVLHPNGAHKPTLLHYLSSQNLFILDVEKTFISRLILDVF